MATTAAQIFPWRTEYSVRIPQIDAQHQQLVALINELHMAMMEGNGKPALTHILSELVRYAENHFAYEETMLQQRGYSGLTGHRLEHKALMGQVYELRDQFASGKTMLTIKVMQFLKEWLANHILTRDMAYARELAK
jgi:hemerythrin-like metal-binding protein